MTVPGLHSAACVAPAAVVLTPLIQPMLLMPLPAATVPPSVPVS
jgi:hypothetical protein